MADEKTPRAKIETEERPRPASERPEGAPTPADDGSYTVGEAVRDGSARFLAWVRRTFPGHEHAFWGGVLGFVVAILFLVLGLFKALVIVVLVVAGVAVGQALDGDSRIVDLLRRIFSRN